MHGSEGDRFIEKHDRDHMLHADIGHVAVADGIGLIGGNADYDFADIVGRELALLEKACEGIQRSLNRRTDRPFFDVGAGNLVAFAEFIGEYAGIGFDDAISRGRTLRRNCPDQKNMSELRSSRRESTWRP